MIPFNKPYLTGKELEYIKQAVSIGKLSGNGIFTRKCHDFFQKRYGFKKCLLTTSCTDALEMAAILCDIQVGDEVIMPSYTFVSTANAFVLRGAKIVFADSRKDHPGIDENKIEELITPRTKVIVPVHYAGVACDMDKIMDIASRNNLLVVEDAAQAVDSCYKGRPLGGIGHLGCFSFHETKNIHSGEGGMLVINDDRFFSRSEIIWEKGTNRVEFSRGKIDKYGWVDIGSSFLPSEVTAAFLFAQLENLSDIQNKRKQIWDNYYKELSALTQLSIQLPSLPSYATNNANMFYLVCNSQELRNGLIHSLKENDILSVFHYLSLNQSLYYRKTNNPEALPESDRYSDCLLRLPFYYELNEAELSKITENVNSFLKNAS
ncbi:MAG: dTDP-4-amino-4,6-dideoxygalactose transaminase [Bacteroidetes bacterium]|nr:dTDP-4-amino-4,6-dideoxygalactose transaminase [Bacteroidota bacterium]